MPPGPGGPTAALPPPHRPPRRRRLRPRRVRFRHHLQQRGPSRTRDVRPSRRFRRALVLTGDGTSVAKHYVAGWLKRGASGVIGTNKPDAAETVESVVEDLQHAPVRPDKPSIESVLGAHGKAWYGYEHWSRINAAEIARGETQGRPRSKFAQWSQLREVAGAPYDMSTVEPGAAATPD